jgi:hypothetical protein
MDGDRRDALAAGEVEQVVEHVNVRGGDTGVEHNRVGVSDVHEVSEHLAHVEGAKRDPLGAVHVDAVLRLVVDLVLGDVLPPLVRTLDAQVSDHEVGTAGEPELRVCASRRVGGVSLERA